MRRGRAIVSATVLEILGEPFVLLVLVASLALATLAPAMHCHQFGEPSRMARDAGMSSLLLGGALVAYAGTMRTFRRELESGTAQSALAHSVSRKAFFLWKALGCAAAYLAFALAVSLVSLTVVRGAEIGGEVAAARGDVARLWGPSFAIAVAACVLPMAASAVLNRFFRFRFTLSANVLSLAVAACGTVYSFDAGLAARLLPAFALAATPSLVLVAASAAFSLRFASNAASALAAAVVAALLPALGNYCLSDALADGGRVPWAYFAAAMLAVAPAVAAPLLVGVHVIEARDVQ
jgi:hypothetical protein